MKDYFLPKSFESFLELDPYFEPPFLALELAENGDFFDLTITSDMGFEEEISKFYSQQLLLALQFMHQEEKYFHRDIKLENILLNGDLELKLCDFSTSQSEKEGNSCGVFFDKVGSRLYMAPEVLLGQASKGSASDLFAAGVSIFAMTTGVMPFAKEASKEDCLYQFLFQKDLKGYWRAFEKFYSGLLKWKPSKEFQEFI